MKNRKAEEQVVFIRSIDKGVKKLVAVMLTLAAALVCFFPVYWMIATSLKTQLDFLEIPPKLIFKPTLDNFRYVLARADFALAYRNSFIISCYSGFRHPMVSAVSVSVSEACCHFGYCQPDSSLRLWLLSHFI